MGAWHDLVSRFQQFYLMGEKPLGRTVFEDGRVIVTIIDDSDLADDRQLFPMGELS